MSFTLPIEWCDGMMAQGSSEKQPVNVRTQVTLDPETQRRAQARAAELNISFAEYVRRLLVNDLGGTTRKSDISTIFDLTDSGPETDVARNKDEMIAKAILDETSSSRERSQAKSKLRTSRR